MQLNSISDHKKDSSQRNQTIDRESHRIIDEITADDIISVANLHVSDMIEEIETPFRRLSNFTMDHFMSKIVNKIYAFDMQPTVFTQRKHRYKSALSRDNDIRIIFANDHYVVSHYIPGRQEAYIYDSAYTRGIYLTTEQLAIFNRFYPGRRYRIIKPASLQLDGSSCGIFAIAFLERNL